MLLAKRFVIVIAIPVVALLIMATQGFSSSFVQWPSLLSGWICSSTLSVSCETVTDLGFPFAVAIVLLLAGAFAYIFVVAEEVVSKFRYA